MLDNDDNEDIYIKMQLCTLHYLQLQMRVSVDVI